MITHAHLIDYFGTIVVPPVDYFVVTLICGQKVWSSRDKYRKSMYYYRESHWEKHRFLPVLGKDCITSSSRRGVTCIGCLVGMPEAP